MAVKRARIVRFRRDPAHPPQLTPEQAKRLDELTDETIDYSDIPAIPDDFWTQHPPSACRTKQQITLRLDPEILEFFREQGRGYQARMNAVLRSYVEAMREDRRRRSKP
jgi:uncharacterized protein (DUF4415 family)